MFLEDSQLASTFELIKYHSIFGFEPLLNLHWGISKLPMEFTFMFLDSDRVMTKPDGVVKHRQPLSLMGVSTVRCVNFLLAASDRNIGVIGLQVGFLARFVPCS